MTVFRIMYFSFYCGLTTLFLICNQEDKETKDFQSGKSFDPNNIRIARLPMCHGGQANPNELMRQENDKVL